MADTNPRKPDDEGTGKFTEATMIRLTKQQRNLIRVWAEEHMTSEAAAIRFFLNKGMKLNASGTEFEPDPEKRYEEFRVQGKKKNGNEEPK